MRAISIRQPWAWLIIHAGKDIENRDWSTNFRGRVLVHAAKGMTRAEWEDGIDTAQHAGVSLDVLRNGCKFDQLKRSGIIGAVDIVDCVQDSESPWFFGKHGFVLRNPAPVPFTPWKGQLGFFDVPLSAIEAASIAAAQAKGGCDEY